MPLIRFHKKVMLGKIYHKLPHEFEELSELEFDLLYSHTINIQEYERSKSKEMTDTSF